jgi:hypothetical protein
VANVFENFQKKKKKKKTRDHLSWELLFFKNHQNSELIFAPKNNKNHFFKRQLPPPPKKSPKKEIIIKGFRRNHPENLPRETPHKRQVDACHSPRYSSCNSFSVTWRIHRCPLLLRRGESKVTSRFSR